MQPPDSGLLILQASLQLGTKQRPGARSPRPARRKAGPHRHPRRKAGGMEPVAWGGG